MAESIKFQPGEPHDVVDTLADLGGLEPLRNYAHQLDEAAGQWSRQLQKIYKAWRETERDKRDNCGLGMDDACEGCDCGYDVFVELMNHA